jgi:hypothetical protein
VCVVCLSAFEPGDALHVDLTPIADLAQIAQEVCVFCQQRVVEEILLEANHCRTLPLARILEIAKDVDLDLLVRRCLRCDKDFVTPATQDYHLCQRCRRHVQTSDMLFT